MPQLDTGSFVYIVVTVFLIYFVSYVVFEIYLKTILWANRATNFKKIAVARLLISIKNFNQYIKHF